MIEKVVPVGRLDVDGAIEAVRALWIQGAADSFVLDFGGLDWVEPFGMLLYGSQLRRFRKQNPSARFKAVNYQAHGYAAHVGFFQSFGLDYGKDPGQAPGSIRYVPVTALTVATLHEEAGQRIQDVREIVEERCGRLAGVLTQGEGGPLQSTLTFSLREIFRNVIEHSRASHIWYAAQYWPEKNRVVLAVLDEGIGIRASLSRNPHLVMRDDADALRLALLPGISGVAFKGGPRLRKNEWANSGYGLFMTSQLCMYGGSFLICSGISGLLLDGQQRSFDVPTVGTALRMEIEVRQVISLRERLAELLKRGRSIAQEVGRGAHVTASMSSRMLSNDFQNSAKSAVTVQAQ